MEKMIKTFGRSLDRLASEKSRLWWESYMKNVSPFRGVGIPDIRKELNSFYRDNELGSWPVEKQFDLALLFFEGKYAEDKLAGILFLQIFLQGKIDYMKTIPRYKKLFTDQLINDWNICDWFCVRVLGPAIENSENACAKWISGWRGEDNIWLSRAALVAFVNLADRKEFYPLLKKSAEILIRRKERFSKTAVGWIMREIADYDKLFVRDFLKVNLKFFTHETLRNSIKHFEKEEKTSWLKDFKSLANKK